MTRTRSKATLHFGTFCPEVSGFGVQLQQAIFHGGSRKKCAFEAIVWPRKPCLPFSGKHGKASIYAGLAFLGYKGVCYANGLKKARTKGTRPTVKPGARKY